MKFYGIPDKLVRIVKLLYETFQCAVFEDGEETDWSGVRTGVKQGCTNMSWFLFLLVIDFIMTRITETEPTGIRWYFTRKHEDLVRHCLTFSKSHDIQQKTQKLNEIARQAGLRINKESKTKVMRNNTDVWEAVKIDEKYLDVETFTYLVGIITTKGGADEDINNRLGKAKSQSGRLRKI